MIRSIQSTNPAGECEQPQGYLDANDAHTLFMIRSIQSTNPAGESEQPQGSFVKLTPVQQAQIAKYALVNGNKAGIQSIKIRT